MRKLLYILEIAVMIYLLYSLAANATLSCNISASCSDTVVFLMENETGGYQNAHAENTSANSYAFKACCNEDTYTLTQACAGANVIRLSNITNAHVQKNTSIDYAVPVCLSTTTANAAINCTYDSSCTPPYICLASMASSEPGDNNNTNAHVGNCSYYDTKICCATISLFDNYPTWWYNSTNATSTEPKVNSTIQFNITLADDVGLSSYIFSWNHSGTWQNLSNVTISGTNSTILINMTVNATGKPTIGWRVFFNDSANQKNKTDVFTFKVKNTAPEIVTLSSPDNNAVTTNRTINFSWLAARDVDDTPLIYEVNITLITDWGVGCTDSDMYANSSWQSLNFIPARDLLCLGDDNYYYNWSVRAYDNESYGPWSSRWNLTINSLVSIMMINDTSDFGILALGTTADTTTNSPYPLTMENNGNVNENINVSATSLWVVTTNPTTNYQFKVSNSSEQGGFNWTGSNTSWTNMPLATGAITAVKKLNYSDVNDTVNVDLRVTVPAAEPPGNKSSTITFEARIS